MPLSFSTSCHHRQLAGAVVISWHSAGERCNPSFPPFFFSKKKKILFFPHHLTVFHRTPQCQVASLTEKSGDGGWGLRSGGSHRTGKQNPKPSAVSERAQERPYLSDKHSLRVITLFQLCNDINKLGIQGVTWVRTNNWIFYRGGNTAQVCLHVMPSLKPAQACN